MKRFVLLIFTACQPLTVTSGVVLAPQTDPAAMCRADQRVTLAPLFADGPTETPSPVVTRADGVIVTTIAGRVRGRHEREARTAGFDTRYFENRSYVLIIEDATSLGRSEITVTFQPNADVSSNGPGTNFRHWKVYGPAGNMGGGYTFAVNIGMNEVTPRELTQIVTENAREQRPLHRGDTLDFELGIYLQGASQLDVNPIAGGSSYFSDTFRYQVGIGGLTPENFDSSGLLGPAASLRLGGDTTVPYNAHADGGLVEPEFAFSQLALNVQPPHAQTFLEGRRLFHTVLATGANTENGNPPMPPFPSAPANQSCEGCHAFNGKLIGLGLLEALDEETIEALADPNDCNQDGVSGRVSVVNGALGRFGDRATETSIANRVRVEFGGFESADVDRLTTYLRVSGVFPQRPGTTGQQFTAIGCATCHVDTLTTGTRHPFAELRGQTIHPYSDLLLHELRDGEVRTAPLWGVGLRLDETELRAAIARHGGEGQGALDGFNGLTAGEQQQLVDFLRSL